MRLLVVLGRSWIGLPSCLLRAAGQCSSTDSLRPHARRHQRHDSAHCARAPPGFPQLIDDSNNRVFRGIASCPPVNVDRVEVVHFP
jgi:hypothetical protein